MTTPARLAEELDRQVSSPLDGDLGDGVAIIEVFRPSAIVPEAAARDILLGLAMRDVRHGGCWDTVPTVWRRYDKPWNGVDEHGDPTPGTAVMMGSLHIAYGMPTRYEITVFRVTITNWGHAQGWNVESITDEALALGGLSLATCPRAHLSAPPPIWRFH